MNNINLNRRGFLAALSLGTAHILLSNPLTACSKDSKSTNPVQKIILGKSGLETTLIGIGTGVHAGNRTSFLTRQEKEKSLSLLHHVYNKGVRMFDCADSYGIHGLVAEVLKGKDRGEYMLSSKI